eukprot:Mrub_09968.p2 GENE.Mrub_09968~~Mrub_09968.p2  ORF type:complete len:156 (+),score=3.67 Mrub_09968:13-480(+)
MHSLIYVISNYLTKYYYFLFTLLIQPLIYEFTIKQYNVQGTYQITNTPSPSYYRANGLVLITCTNTPLKLWYGYTSCWSGFILNNLASACQRDVAAVAISPTRVQSQVGCSPTVYRQATLHGWSSEVSKPLYRHRPIVQGSAPPESAQTLNYKSD